MEFHEFKRALGGAELRSLKRFNNLLSTLKSFDLENEKVDSLDQEKIQLETINLLTHPQEDSPEKDLNRSPKERLSAQGSTEYEVTMALIFLLIRNFMYSVLHGFCKSLFVERNDKTSRCDEAT